MASQFWERTFPDVLHTAAGIAAMNDDPAKGLAYIASIPAMRQARQQQAEQYALERELADFRKQLLANEARLAPLIGDTNLRILQQKLGFEEAASPLQLEAMELGITRQRADDRRRQQEHEAQQTLSALSALDRILGLPLPIAQQVAKAYGGLLPEPFVQQKQLEQHLGNVANLTAATRAVADAEKLLPPSDKQIAAMQNYRDRLASEFDRVNKLYQERPSPVLEKMATELFGRVQTLDAQLAPYESKRATHQQMNEEFVALYQQLRARGMSPEQAHKTAEEQIRRKYAK